MRRFHLGILAGSVGFLVGSLICLLVVHEYDQAVLERKNYEVYIDPAFSQMERREIVDALDAWRKAADTTDHPLFFSLHYDNRFCTSNPCRSGIITFHETSRTYMKLLRGKPDPIIGLTDHGNVYIANDILLVEDRKKVLLHEIGHALFWNMTRRRIRSCMKILDT